MGSAVKFSLTHSEIGNSKLQKKTDLHLIFEIGF